MLEHYLAKRCGDGNKGVSWKNINAEILPGYCPGRIDLSEEKRDAVNRELERLEREGYLVLTRYKKERAFTLYSAKFTDKMEVLCRIYGIRTIAEASKGIIRTLYPLQLSVPAIEAWRENQIERAKKGKPDRIFWRDGIPYSDIGKAVRMADAVMQNTEQIYIRDIAKRVLGGSKLFDGNVKKKACALIEKCSDKEVLDKLEETRRLLGKNASILPLYGVVATPQYIPAFGNMEITTPVGVIVSRSMPYVFLSDSMDKYMKIKILTNRFITFENRTTYEDFDEEGYTKLYTGGFPGYAEKELLHRIREDNPDTEYYHWSDIDCGGFRIFEDIRRIIPEVAPFHMDIDTLKKYSTYTDRLTENDRKNLAVFQSGRFASLASYMLRHNVKLEQESLYA